VVQRLAAAGLRVTFDDSNGTMQAKVREASLQKIPYTVVIGDKEVETDQVSVRTFGADKAKMETLPFADFAQRLAEQARFP
ncbi:MAG: threonine--tRNA ligase, partial [Deltaproteobacteria bacterium]|nr:threonine--tRNA ligase [Deltaproteobacteria bacterium]